jgi:hypothetical protein
LNISNLAKNRKIKLAAIPYIQEVGRMDREYTNSKTRNNAATLIGLVCVVVGLLACSEVGRTFTCRQLNERYSAETSIGEKALPRNGGKGAGTGGQGPADFVRQTPGAGDASVHGLIQRLVTQPNANPNLDSNCGNPKARK